MRPTLVFDALGKLLTAVAALASLNGNYFPGTLFSQILNLWNAASKLPGHLDSLRAHRNR